MNPLPESFYIGWDVGGWNCDHNQKSRDAIVILSHDLSIVGRPWRGNLRALLGLWGDYSLNKNRIEIQSAEMEHDVCF
jgi:hypothetical protein